MPTIVRTARVGVRRSAAVPAALLILTCAALTAGQAPDDARVIEQYRLTAGRLEQVMHVNRLLLQEMKSDPTVKEWLTLRAETEALSRKQELTPAEAARLKVLQERTERLADEANPLAGEASSLAEMEARIRTFPPLMRALAREGMQPREYATFWMAFMQAAVVHEFQKSGMLKDPPAGVNMENVKFIAEHAAEIETMQKELEALGRGR